MIAKQVQLDIRKGAVVWCGDQEYVVTHIAGLDQVVAKNLVTGSLDTLKITDLGPPPAKSEQENRPQDHDLLNVSKEDWDEAKC